jgi:FtsP/CotA-like multicopper oxidase with cupredoxin domain
MLSLRMLSCAALVSALVPPHATAQTAARPAAQKDAAKACPRGAEGGSVTDPADLRSQNGVLKVALIFRNSFGASGHMLYCYIDEHGNQAPTLRLQPGDTLILTLKDEISLSPAPSPQELAHAIGHASPNHSHSLPDPCSGGVMTARATNLHFHGMTVPPVCHQDDTLQTMLQPSSPPFEYRIQIPKNQSPGLY